MLKRYVGRIPLVLIIALAMIACTKTQRTDTLKAAIITVNGLRDAAIEWDRKHQDKIIDSAKARNLTKAEVTAELAKYYEQRDPMIGMFVDIYRFIAFAATEEDDQSLDTALDAVKNLREAIGNFQKLHQGSP